MITCGVYEIRNKLNGDRYIGSSNNISKRLIVHRRNLMNKNHFNPHLQRAWNLYGDNNFEFNILLECKQELLLIEEQKFLDERPKYNIAINAQAFAKGRICSEDERRRISERLRGRPSPNKGFVHSEKARLNMSIAHLGKKLSEETKRKMSESQLKRTFNDYWLGKKMPEYVKRKMSDSQMGHIVSEETKKKISDTHKARFIKQKGAI